MRIEKPANGLYQAKLAQDQIEVVSNDLVSSTGALNSQITIVNNNLIAASSALDTKIDSSLSNLRVRHLNSLGTALFSTTSTSTVFITGSNTLYTKKYSTTELRVSVFVVATVDLSNYVDTIIGSLSYSINGGTTWLSATSLRGSGISSGIYASNSYLVHFNLGVLPSGTVDFRIGCAMASGNVTLRIGRYSYLFIEAAENA